MKNVAAFPLAMLLSTAAQAEEYMEKTPFQLSRAFSPGVITSGGTIVWVAGQTATQDSQATILRTTSKRRSNRYLLRSMAFSSAAWATS
jgi:hypothetical protein